MAGNSGIGNWGSGRSGNTAPASTNEHVFSTTFFNRNWKGSAVPKDSLASYQASIPAQDNSRNSGEWWEQQANADISSGLGATNPYETNVGNFINTNPFTNPDYVKNWVNDGSAGEFANLHTRPVTNQWARYADAFNNMRHWDPGQEATAGPAGAGVTQTGDYGQGKRWEPIDTQELRAQQRAEEYEDAVRQAGIRRQDKYAQGPYDMMIAHQQAQMNADYGLDEYKAKSKFDWRMLQAKAAAVSSSTGIYARALYALTGIGSMVLNPFDESMYRQMSAICSNPSLTQEQKNTACAQIIANSVSYKATAVAGGLPIILGKIRRELGNDAYGDLMTNLAPMLQSIYNPALQSR